MFLSVIICTRNRADEIVNCLPLIAAQAKNFSDVEVLVIDNGSTDHTKETVERLAAGNPIRYVYEPVAGLCQARNRGAAESRGRVLVYIDDDVQIQDDWIARIRAHFEAGKSDCLGGKVSVRLEGQPPFEIGEEMLWFFQATAFGDAERRLRFPEHPIGCNMAFRREVFEAVGGFNTELKLYGDETDFFRRAAAKDFLIVYDPRIEVSQIIPAGRLTVEELRHKSYIWGKGSATLWLLSTPGFFRRSRKIAEFSLRAVYVGLSSLVSWSFGKFYTFWYNCGYLAQLLRGLERK